MAPKALVGATDVTRADQLKRLVDVTVRSYGRIDVMINNAGLMPDSPLERLKIDDWDRMIDVNTSRVCSPASPLARLAASGRPRIIRRRLHSFGAISQQVAQRPVRRARRHMLTWTTTQQPEI
jgi:NAD(P)-dependent dehydrogenase (short-subunit alcohol dehydrogenase family)